LLAEAERDRYDRLLTADNKMRYQQNLTGRRIALVVLSTPQWPRVQLNVDNIAAVLKSVKLGSYAEIEIPYAANPEPDSPGGRIAFPPPLLILAKQLPAVAAIRRIPGLSLGV
jgi:hypothetical protein